MRATLSFKINLIVFLVVLSLGSTLGSLFIIDQKKSLQKELDRRIDLLGAHMAEEFTETGMQPDALSGLLQAVALDPEICYVMVKSPDGEVLASRWQTRQQGAVQEYDFPLTDPSNGGATALFGPVTENQRGDLIGRFSIGVDLQPLHAKISRLIARTAAVVLFAIAVSLIAGYGLVRVLFQRSLSPLLSGIAAIGSGDLSRRIHPRRGDEIGRIGSAFDEMAERLSATLITKEHLEAAVEERTSELKTALDDRTRAQAELADREEHIRLLLESTAEAIYGLDLNGSCTFCNPAAVRLLGYRAAEDLIGKNMHQLIHHTMADGSAYPVEQCGIYSVFRTGKGVYERDEIMWKADGSCMHVELWSYPIFKGEELLGTVVTFLDITDRLKLEQQLLQAQKMEAIGLLAGGVAHDFNNILTAIYGYGSLLQMKIPAADPLRVNVDQLLESAERAAQLTRSLLAFSRKQVLDMKAVHLNEIIARQEKFLRRIIGEDIEMRTILNRDTVIMADSTQIEQVLMNLATNARDAMPKGGRLTIETDQTRMTDEFVAAHGFGSPGIYALLTVTDTGTGMDEETQLKIFDPFFTTKEVGHGTGLGMAIIYGIVKQHKGYINVYSQVGAGTTFRIYIPMQSGAAEGQAPAAKKEIRTGTETILLAEDDRILRGFFRDLMTQFGYTVIVAEDGVEALERFRERKDQIQLSIIDMVMPKRSGKDVYDEIQKIKPGARVIFSSGYADRVLTGGFPAGSDFIAKPAPPEEFLDKIRQALDRGSS